VDSRDWNYDGHLPYLVIGTYVDVYVAVPKIERYVGMRQEPTAVFAVGCVGGASC
jgi:hypothetical protein